MYLDDILNVDNMDQLFLPHQARYTLEWISLSQSRAILGPQRPLGASSSKCSIATLGQLPPSCTDAIRAHGICALTYLQLVPCP